MLTECNHVMGKLLQELMGTDGESFPSLSPKELVILRMLASGDLYGQEMVDRSEGELKRGTVYVTLARMEDKGFVESHQESRPQREGGLPRRKYKISGEGQRALTMVEKMALSLAGGRFA